MKIVVLLSAVPDTTVRVQLSPEGVPQLSEVPLVINPWDELALTRALELKEEAAGVVERVEVLHAGPAAHENVLRRALAMGADEAIRLDTSPQDATSAAAALAEWLKDHPAEIILAGIESSDYNGGATGMRVARRLGIRPVGGVTALQVEGETVLLTRELEGMREVLQVTVPLLAVVQKGIAREPRVPSMRGIMMARRKTITVVPVPAAEPWVRTSRYAMPPGKPPVKMIPAERAEEILELLEKEAKVIRFS